VSYFKIEKSNTQAPNRQKSDSSQKKNVVKKTNQNFNSKVRSTGINLRLSDTSDNNFETF